MMAMSKVVAKSSLTEEQTNYLRFAQLLMNIAPKAVRVVFDNYFPPGGLQIRLNRSKVTLQQIRKLSKTQMALLYPLQGTVKSSDMDITLMICLLRNLHKMKIQDKLPADADISEEADVSRIKHYRNLVAHNTDGHISKPDFEAIWKHTYEAIARLGGTSLKLECDSLMSANLDSSYREVLIAFAQQESKLSEMTEELKSEKEKISQLEERKDNSKDNLLIQVADWEHDNQNFFATSAVEKIFEIVVETSFVLITGSSGMGKSAIAHHTALLFRDLMEYEILLICQPVQIIQQFDLSRKQIVIIDDICGTFAVDKALVNSWIQYKSSIEKLTRKAKDSLRIVATCRLHVRESKEFKNLMKDFEIKECNLLSDELAVDLNERREIGLCHLNEECLDMLEEEVIATTQMFPLLCKLSSEKFNPDFFRNPYEIVKQELDGIASKNKKCFFGLALLVIYNNNLGKCLFKERCDNIFNEIFDDVFEDLEMSNKPSKLAVLRSIETLKGTFIKENECSVTAIHDKVFDYIAFFVGGMLLKTILKYGNSRLIFERMSFEFLNELSESEFVIMIDKHHEEMYLRRIGEEIRNRKFEFVLCTDISETEYYQENVISMLSEHDDLLSIFTRNLWALVLSALNPCDMLYTFAKDRVEKKDSNQTSVAESKPEGSKLIVVCDTQITIDYQYHRRRDSDDSIDDNNDADESIDDNNDADDSNDDNDDDNKRDIYLKSPNGPLFVAIEEGRPDVVNLLLKSGNAININKTITLHNLECTPLKFAYDSDEPDIAKILIDCKADVNVLYEGNCTLLHIVCADGNTDFLEVLLGCEECDLNVKNDFGETPLFLACKNSETQCVEFLVASQCNINISNIEGKSPLH